MPIKLKRYKYLAFLYASVVLMLIPGPYIAGNILLVFVQIAGVWLVLWVLWTNRVDKFELSLRLGKKNRLVAKGPYKLVRYPLYGALLLITLSLLLSRPDIWRLMLWIVQCVATILIIRVDEAVLSKAFRDFSLYRQRTYRLIPFLY